MGVESMGDAATGSGKVLSVDSVQMERILDTLQKHAGRVWKVFRMLQYIPSSQ